MPPAYVTAHFPLRGPFLSALQKTSVFGARVRRTTIRWTFGYTNAWMVLASVTKVYALLQFAVMPMN
jgi:hypothetical protein